MSTSGYKLGENLETNDYKQYVDQKVNAVIGHYYRNVNSKRGIFQILRIQESGAKEKGQPFNPEQGAAFYCAKYAAKQLGALHFGGPLQGEPFTAVLKPGPTVGHTTVTPSPAMPRDEFRRSEFYPRGFSTWRSKR